MGAVPVLTAILLFTIVPVDPASRTITFVEDEVLFARTFPVMSTFVPWSLVKGGFKKTPHFNNVSSKTAAGRRSTVVYQPYATWDFEVDLDFVSGGESVQYSVLQSFLSLYLQTCGGGGPFLFTDPNDSAVDDTGLSTPQSCMLNVTPGAAVPMGQAGDGASNQFQLARLIGAGVDILQNVSNVLVLVNGVVVTPASISATGVVTFATAPAAAAVLTWAGAFQYLCQFSDDTLKDLARVNRNTDGWLWSCGSIAFEGLFQ